MVCSLPGSSSMGFSRQEYWSGLPLPSPGDLPDPGWNSGLLHCRQMLYHLSHQGSPSGKEPPCQYRRHEGCRFDPWLRKIPWRRKWQPTLVFLPEKFHGKKRPVSYSPWGRREWLSTQPLHHLHPAPPWPQHLPMYFVTLWIWLFWASRTVCWILGLAALGDLHILHQNFQGLC